MDEKLEELRGELRPQEEGFLSAEETCERYGFSRSTWDRLWAQRTENGLEGIVVRLGRRLLIPPRDFEAWASQRGQLPGRGKRLAC